MLANISVWQLAIIALIVVLLFGTKRIRQAGEDFGGMIGGFRKEIKDIDPTDVVSDVNKVRKTAKAAKKMLGK